MAVVTEELFGVDEARAGFPEVPSGISATRRRTLRRLILIELGEHPITHLPLHPDAPDDASRRDRYPRAATCGTCAHRVTLEWHDKRYPKCDLLAPDVLAAHSAVTDTPRWLPACTAYRPAE